ncbi:DUF2304 domain-containing protein [Chromatocurvus halotolerans]|uniref:DUF2304 domain-containing protein n=1 Tax=Chromatocurvus halotolerans TaxID=1132028 RepID=A0A4R2K916_9GAMM|nr:DUF2304 domain-containing protein [Chromatocurvus halotolerans]TCO69871.1 hypothetical protein EV688_1294 [Chromatocurvus halotolerans]
MIALVSGSIGLFVAIAILVLMRRDKLHAGHGLGWFLVAVAFACLGFAPGIVDTIARWLGIEYPPALALTVGMAVLVLKLLLMDIERSRIEMRHQRLTQRIAMLEATLRHERTGVEKSVPENDP